MRRLVLSVVLVMAVATTAVAQLAGGNIFGVVRDSQGGVLPGVTVTLKGPDRTLTVVTDATGGFRFRDLAPGAYALTLDLSGFATVVREHVVVTVGTNIDLPITMRVAQVQETLTVSAPSPVVDARSTGTATNFTQDELAKIPTSRDPWALLRTVPGVQMDRVNIGGNETGQQSNFQSKGTSRNNTVWTMDGVVITDMSAVGASPTYFDFDAFEEIQISTGGTDIRQPTGGVGLNMVVKRGTNRYAGTARGYWTNDSLEAANVPDELANRGVTAATADHNNQITDTGFDLGGPIVRDKAWAWGSFTRQDIRLNRQAGNLEDRTILDTVNVKGNWQATSNDHISVLWFLGSKEKFGRGTGQAQVEAPSATWNQGARYPDNRPKGLVKVEANHVFGTSVFVSGRYASYGTGFSLEPQGGLDGQASISTRLGQTFGTTRALRFLRPQDSVGADGNYYTEFWGGRHDFRFGGGYRRHDSTVQAIWPGNKLVAIDNSLTDQRARLFREAQGTNRNEYFELFVGDTFQTGPLTLNLGVRYDRQWGSALPSETQSNDAFPSLVPGIQFPGFDAPFTWNTLYPRLGATYALDESRRTLLRASFNMYAGQLDAGTVGFNNPAASANPGFADYPWVDLNGDRFVQPNEVLVNRGVVSFGGGFDPANPTSVSSPDLVDPDLKAPRTTAVIVGVDREVARNLGVQVNYSYARAVDFVGPNGNADLFQQTFIPWRGLTAADYLPGPVVSGVLPDGTPFSVPTFIPDPAKVAANGNARFLTNYDGYRSTYHGIEASIVKRLSNRWMMRAALAYNNPREFYEGTPVNVLGNPTRTEANPLVQGGQVAPRSSGSGAGDVFINGKWQVNVNGVYQLPYDLEIAGNFFGRQGNPFPIFQTASLGLDGSQRVLVSPEVDTFRHDNLWNLDLRLAKHLRYGQFQGSLIADLFNVLNQNTELNRQRNLASPNFNNLTQNLSPRIFRLGVRIGF